MHQHRSKRSHAIRLILTYTLVPVIVVSLSTMLVLYMLGWRYNIGEQTVAQGGLMQFNTRPSGATVKVNGKLLSDRTSAREDMPAGRHNISMELEGYLPWQKTVAMDPGKILWLNYARLIPEQIEVDSVRQFDKLVDAVAGPYGEEYMLLQPSREQARFILAETDNDEAPTTEIIVPEDVLAKAEAGKVSEFSIQSWDRDARYVLVTQKHSKGIDWLVVDTREPSRSQNVTDILGAPIDQAEFYVDNPRALYVLSNGALMRVDLTRRTASEPLVGAVESFRQSDQGVITYVGFQKNTPNQRFVGYYTSGAAKPKQLHLASDSSDDKLQAEIVEHLGQQYLVTRLNDQLTVARMTPLPSDSPANIKLTDSQRFSLPDQAGDMTISRDGRFVLVQKDASFLTYDFELRHLTTTSQVGEGATRPVRWLDNHLLWSDRGGLLHTYEFDGENGHPIMEVSPGFDVSLSPNGRYLYAIEKNEEGFSLSRARLILP